MLVQLPQIRCALSVKGWWEGAGAQEDRAVPTRSRSGLRPNSDWIQVHADQEYVLNIDCKRLNRRRVWWSFQLRRIQFGNISSYDVAMRAVTKLSFISLLNLCINKETEFLFPWSVWLLNRFIVAEKGQQSLFTALSQTQRRRMVCSVGRSGDQRSDRAEESQLYSQPFQHPVGFLHPRERGSGDLHPVHDERLLPRAGPAVRYLSGSHPCQSRSTGNTSGAFSSDL